MSLKELIGEIRNGNLKEIPEDLLYNEHYSEAYEPIINIERVDLKIKMN